MTVVKCRSSESLDAEMTFSGSKLSSQFHFLKAGTPSRRLRLRTNQVRHVRSRAEAEISVANCLFPWRIPSGRPSMEVRHPCKVRKTDRKKGFLIGSSPFHLNFRKSKYEVYQSILDARWKLVTVPSFFSFILISNTTNEIHEVSRVENFFFCNYKLQPEYWIFGDFWNFTVRVETNF